MGVVVADLVVTAVLLAVMVRWFAPLIRPVFSRAVLREALAFGLPRVPHGFAQQVIAVGDTFVLDVLRRPGDDRALLDGRQRRPDPEGLSRGLRVRVGAVLLRDGPGTRRAANLQPRSRRTASPSSP